MQYLTYEKYLVLGGKTSETAFSRLEFSARRTVDRETYGRIAADMEAGDVTYKDELEYLMVELIELSVNTANQIKSESNEGVSVSYETMSTEDIQRKQSTLIESYLQGLRDRTGQYLLFGGGR